MYDLLAAHMYVAGYSLVRIWNLTYMSSHRIILEFSVLSAGSSSSSSSAREVLAVCLDLPLLIHRRLKVWSLVER